jgi:tRNA pseudouridine38-40 synthase
VSTLSETDEPASLTGDGGLIRLRLDLSYDGTEFFGWARQPEQRTVQQVVEEALATVMRLDGPPRLVVAGRTDTGVHAVGQVAHVDVPTRRWEDVTLLDRRLAGILPQDVVLRGVAVAAVGFDARFSALGRHYRYRVDDGVANPLRRHDTVSWQRPLDTEQMHEAAQGLVGQHDFAAYCKPRDGATTIRTLKQLDVSRDPDSVVIITVSADAFCRHQVRSMVGALLAVGDGRRLVSWPVEVLTAGVRIPEVNVAAAKGLTLVAVDYPPDDDLAARAELTRQRRTR